MSLKTGPADWVFPPHHRVKIRAEGYVSIFKLDEKNEPVDLLASSMDGVLVLRTAEEISVRVNVDPAAHWAIDLEPLASPVEKTDPVPVEMPSDAHGMETMEDKLQRMLASMVRERFGQNSEEFETMEEHMDFDVDEDVDDQVMLSGYEVKEMVEDFPVDQAPPSSPAEPPPKAEPEADEQPPETGE
jgi:hypothetical protein